MFAGRLAGPGGSLTEVARAARAAPRPLHDLRPPDFMLDGLATHFNTGYAAGVKILRRALATFGAGMSTDEQLRWLWLAQGVAMHIWEDEPLGTALCPVRPSRPRGGLVQRAPARPHVSRIRLGAQ